jgi:hypothetical protein
MTCADVEAATFALAGGTVPAEVQRHLAGCAACRDRIGLWQGLLPAMRADVPEPVDALRMRRWQGEIERRLATTPEEPARARWSTAVAAAAAAVVLVAGGAVGLLAVRAHREQARSIPAAAWYATVVRADGVTANAGLPLRARDRLAPGDAITVAASGEAELALDDRGTRVRLWGPAHLALGGGAREVALALHDGTLQAAVAHRRPDERFAVGLADARVEVRGTRFTVSTGASGSWVRVDEGLVAVTTEAGATRLIAAGESAASPFGEIAPIAGDDEHPEPAPPERPSCAEAARACRAAAGAAHRAVRSGAPDRALRLAIEGARDLHGARAACGGGVAACQDELGYLRAEALRVQGRLDEAVHAFKVLDGNTAPPAMRQNALYAAAEIERRLGRSTAAQADYERAFAAAPRGPLRDEALAGAMDSAAAGGGTEQARALARRYLAQFPHGMAAARARRLAGGAEP